MKNISVRGTIVSNDDAWIYDLFGIENTSPKRIAKELRDAGEDDVTIEVNSGGGDVFAGNDIYYCVSAYKGKSVTADITGLAASAATIVCCGAQKVRAVPGAQYMIHNVSTYGAEGDHNDMDKMSEILRNADKSISNIYRVKTGMSNEELLALMDTEKWMDVDEAMKYGFIDEIIGDNGRAENRKPITIYNASTAIVLSDEVKERVREKLMENPGENATGEDIQKLRNELRLLKLRGGK